MKLSLTEIKPQIFCWFLHKIAVEVLGVVGAIISEPIFWLKKSIVVLGHIILSHSWSAEDTFWVISNNLLSLLQ